MSARPKRDKNGNPVRQPTTQIEPIFAPELSAPIQDMGFVQASLVSLDTGQSLEFLIEPSDFDLDGTTVWVKPGVIYASHQPSEYQTTNPLVRTITAHFDAYSDGDDSRSIQPQIDMLEVLRARVPGKNRAHIVMYIQGETNFIGKILNWRGSVRRLNRGGGPLQIVGAQITIEDEEFF